MPQCNRCNQAITWGDKYVKGDKPKNMDGSTHYCKNDTENFAENYKSKTPRLTAEQALSECVLFNEAFKDLEPAKFETVGKIFISRMMSR